MQATAPLLEAAPNGAVARGTCGGKCELRPWRKSLCGALGVREHVDLFGRTDAGGSRRRLRAAGVKALRGIH